MMQLTRSTFSGRATASIRQTTSRGVVVRRPFVAYARAGGQPFNEGASQVKRLISRDRKEFLGNEGDILEKFETEFGAPEEAVNPFASGATPAAPSNGVPVVSGTAVNPFKPAAAASPFGAAAPAKPFKQPSIEPKGLNPSMGPDPVIKETPIDLLKSITLTQVLIVLSFTLIIALMIGTFAFVLKVGGIRLAGLE